ncbi:MAG: RIP metalloprotease RseP [Candidatus Muirbacterium halophilum]|nr:RIP metalloprotease RseP [Candidatus Muirbacterium halophilum]MCK9475330.1 RIP metalloprotease RseP [Candidatus Muirbacterium halophilum]
MLMTLVSFLFVIFVIVLVHEFGHFTVAKLSGIKVNEFSVGFGPKLFSKKKGETLYVIRGIPLGGFVDLYGMEEDSVSLDSKDWDKSFVSKKPLPRFLTLIAGSFMNFVLAFFIFFIVGMTAGTVEPLYIEKPVIFVAELNTDVPTAYSIGFRTGDIISFVNGEKIEKFKQLPSKLENIKAEIKVNLIRNGNSINIIIPQNSIKHLSKFGIYQSTEPVIGEIANGQEADNKGLLKGDRIVKIEDKDIYSWEQAAILIHKSLDTELDISIKRGEKLLQFEVTPRDLLNNGNGLLGISASMRFSGKMGFIKALKHAGFSVVAITKVMYEMIVKLVTGSVSVKNLQGPVGMASIIGDRAEEGLTWLFFTMAYISINIGFLNLLPYPALDGGRLLFIVIEFIGSSFTGRKVKISSKVEEIIHYAGLVSLILLILVVTYRDILRIFNIGG